MQPIEGAPTTEVTEISAQDFIALHAAALEADEVRHNVVLGILGRLGDEDAPPPRLWSLGAPGACALQTPGRPIALGALEARQCHALAEATRNTNYAAVGGPGHAASAFAERAAQLGVEFEEPTAQFIHALRGSPRYPGATGQARLATAGDAPLLYAWMCGFQREVLPHDPPPQVAHLARRAEEGCFMFWIVNGEPVSVAAIARAPATRRRSPASTPLSRNAAAAMLARLSRLRSNWRTRKASRWRACIPISAIRFQTDAMPKSASCRSAKHGTTRVNVDRRDFNASA